MRDLNRSVLLGGALGGLLSVIPVVNLLNLFFMLWVLVGVGVTVNRLTRRNGRLAAGDALLAGSLSGLVSGVVFAVAGLLMVLRLDPDRLAAALDRVRLLAPREAEEIMHLVQSGRLRPLLLLSLGLFVLLAIVAGGLSALLWRLIVRPAPANGGDAGPDGGADG